MTSAAIYARVSSARQREEETIGSQTAALREARRALGLEVPDEWVFDDEGYSGATLVRPALERLRDLVAQVPVDVVLCYSPDRLARRYAYQALLIEEFARAGTEVRFVKGPRADTPEDELLVQFQGMIAEYEKAQIVERTRRGKTHRARAGRGQRAVRRPVRLPLHAPQRPRRGPLRDRRTRGRRGRRDCSAATPRTALSIADLARWLSAEGVPTSTGKTRWDRSTIWGMLRNPAYAGRAVYLKTDVSSAAPALNRTARRQGRAVSRHARTGPARRDRIEIPVPAIVTTDTFAAAARRLEDNKRFSGPQHQGALAAARAWWPAPAAATATTAPRRAPPTGKIYYYRCLGSDDYRYEHGRVCENQPVRADYLDDLVWDHITATAGRPGADPRRDRPPPRRLRAATPPPPSAPASRSRSPRPARGSSVSSRRPGGPDHPRRTAGTHARPARPRSQPARPARRPERPTPRP